jgi:hypothetical protein
MADNNIDPELIRELNEKYGQMRDAISSMIPAMVLSTTAINQMIAASKGLAVSEKDGKQVVDEFLKSIKKSTEENETAAKATAEKNKKEVAVQKLKDAEKEAFKQFGTALFSSTVGMEKYGNAIRKSTSALGDYLVAQGGIAAALGYAIKVLGFFTEAVLKQNDLMIKSYDSLSEVGATSALTTNDIRKLGLNAGYTSENLEKFTNISKGLGTNLLALGTTAGKGVVEFSKVATVGQDTRDAFNRLGIGQEELTKIQANYIKTTIASGRSLSQSPQLLKEQSLKYATVLQELTSLTGMNRDEVQKAFDEANSNLNFQIHMNSLEEKEIALRKNRLDAEADIVKKQIENTYSVVAASKKMNSAQDHTATLYLIAGKTWSEATAGLATKQPGLLKLFNTLESGKDITSDYMDQTYEANKTALKTIKGLTVMNEGLVDTAKAFGISSESLKFNAEYGSKDQAERKKALELIKKETADKLAGRGAFDAAKEAQNEQLRTELQLKSAFDELTNTISGPVNKGFVLLMQMTRSLAKTFAEISFKFGGPDLRHLFKTPEELKQDIDDLTKDISKLETVLDRETQIKQDKLKVDQEINDKEKQLATASIDDKAKLNREIRALQNKQVELQKEAMKTGGPGFSETDSNLSQKRKQLEEARQRARDAGVSVSPSASRAGNATPAQLEERSANAGLLGKGIAGKENDVLAKLRFKDKDENTGGGKADPKLLDIAQKINEAFPNSTITALNDVFHQNLKDANGKKIYSRHQDGKALDFSLNPAPKDADEAALFKYKLQQMGASKVLDEYFSDKTDKTRGGHFHVEVARNGGLFSGPSTGYPVILHDDELITPMNKVQNVSKTELSSLPMMDSGSGGMDGMSDMIEMLSEKLDTMINRLDTSNSIQDDLLKYSRA